MNTNYLFPESLYPFHSRYVNLLINMITSKDFEVSSIDMEILSLALGRQAHTLFQDVSRCTTTKEKLNSIVADGLALKVSVKNRVKEINSEISITANKGVIDVVMAQYQMKMDEIARHKQELFRKEKEKIDNQKMLKEKQGQEKLIQQRLLHQKNHVDYPDFDIFDVIKNSRVAKLLSQLRNKAIDDEDLQWLEEIGFANDIIHKKNSSHIAKQHLINWQTKNKPWELVNASAAYRKLDRPNTIKHILDDLYPFKFSNNNDKLKSALLTTYGGVCRDTNNLKRSLVLGHEAHEVTPLNFRPCTLLGAVYLSTGEFDAGHEWYEKAKERGFSQEAYDNDIRSIYRRASQGMKKRLKQNLIETGHHYKWLENKDL